MSIEEMLEILNTHPEQIEFGEVIGLIDDYYEFVPTAFRNGDVFNETGQNNGSCKIFSFGLLHGLDKNQLLCCFGSYYKEVVANPEGDDHQNIRNFMATGWEGIEMQGQALKRKRQRGN